MKKLLWAVFCALLLTVSAFAADYTVTRIDTDCTAERSSACRITQAIDLAFNGTVSAPSVPVASGAKHVTLTGADYSLREKDGATYAILKSKSGFIGTLHLTVSYTVDGTVTQEGETQIFTATLLEGLWDTAVERYSATVSFPEELPNAPVFTSGYYSEDIAQRLTTGTEGRVVSTSLRGGLLDHESFTVTLRTTTPLFRGYHKEGSTAWQWIIPVFIALLLALCVYYWFRNLRSRRLFVHARTYAPEAMTPAEIPFVLFGEKCRFGLLVCQWAALGYLTVSVQSGKVILCRVMEMGTERREEERKLFELMFRHSDECACHSALFRHVSELAQRSFEGYWSARLFDRKGGSVAMLRLITAVATGTATAYTMAQFFNGGFFQWLFVILGLFAGGGCGIVITYGYTRLRIRDYRGFGISLAALLFPYLLGRFADTMLPVVLSVLCAFFTAYVATAQGRLSAIGGGVVEQALGYRRYLSHISVTQLEMMLTGDLQSFYETLLFAQALGMSRNITNQMQGKPLPNCSWLRVGDKEKTYTPQQFTELLRRLLRKIESA